MTVSATIDHAHVKPDRPVQPDEDVAEDVLDRREDPADDHVRAFRERPKSGKSVWSRA